MFRVRSSLINTCLALFDLAVVAACYLGTLWLLSGWSTSGADWKSFINSDRVLALGWILVIWLALLAHFGMYQSRRMSTVFADLGIIAKTAATGLVILSALAHFVPALGRAPYFSLWLAGSTLVTMAAARVVVRVVLRELRRRGWNIKKLVLVTSPENSRRLSEKLAERAHYGYHVVRHLKLSGATPAESSRLLTDFRQTLEETRSDDAILALPVEERALTAQLVEECETRGVNVRLVPDLHPLVQSATQVHNLGGIPLVDVHLYPTESLGYTVLKRVFDVVVSVVVLVAAAPLVALIAAAVKLTSPGPVLFVQERVGLNGRRFRMLKFRTMRADAGHNPESHWTTPDEPSLTPVGRWLRRSNLDELPQFFNVLKGDMSVVGPRPERPHFIERFRHEIPNYMLRHYVKCGITGWAQVNGWRGDTSIRERLAHDLYYMQNWGLALDVKILVWTLTRTFFHPNAY